MLSLLSLLARSKVVSDLFYKSGFTPLLLAFLSLQRAFGRRLVGVGLGIIRKSILRWQIPSFFEVRAADPAAMEDA